MLSRIFLFALMNILVMVAMQLVLFVLQNVFGIEIGGGMIGLMVSSAVFGFVGSFFSLFISKFMAKRSCGAVVIQTPRNESEQWLLGTVRGYAERAGIGMPEVAIFPSADLNAFATGWNRNNALVAVSSGLLQTMTRQEAEAVIGHEISHVANGDMVTMTLLQGVMNTFVIFFSRLLASLIEGAIAGRDDNRRRNIGGGFIYMMVSTVLQITLGLLASIVLAWFSRHREFRADAGGGQLAGKGDMIAALRRLQGGHVSQPLPKALAAFGISSGGVGALMATHPPLEVRIAALEAAA